MTNKFYQGFMEQLQSIKDYEVVKVKDLPEILVKVPGVKDIQEMGILKGNLDTIGDFVTNYILKNCYEKLEDDKVGEQIFTLANKDQLMKKWTPLHTEVYQMLTKVIGEEGNEQKPD